MNTFSEYIHVLAALYHESGRTSVAAGDTLAHAEGQARPFTEFSDLSRDAREGRLMTAENLAKRIRIAGFADQPSLEAVYDADVDRIANIIHEAERDAIEAGKVVVKLNPPRPWIPLADLPPQAKAGRRRQAMFFANRFTIEIVT